VAEHSLHTGVTGIERALFVLLIVVAVAGCVVDVRNTAGWLLMVLSFAVFLLDPSVREDSRTRYSIWVVMTLHHAVALLFAFAIVSFSIDAESFHRYGVKFATSGEHFFAIDFEFYTQALSLAYRLGGFYKLGGESRLLGAELSVFGFAVALMVFMKLVEMREARYLRPIAVLLFGCLPAVVVYTSIPMRESFELASLILFSYLFVVFLNKPRLWLLMALFPVLVLFGLLHKGLILYAVFLACLVLLAAVWMGAKRRAGPAVLLAAALILLGCGLIVYLVSHFDVRNSGAVNYFLSGQILENLERGRHMILKDNPRTAFSTDIDFSSAAGFIATYLQVYWQYLAAPFVWNVAGASDLVACGQALLRLCLFAAAVLSLLRTGADPAALLLFVMYLTMTMLWALGTTNYGQALRHHVLTDWMLIVLGLPWLQYLVTGRRRGSLAGAT
jgi:hypothetical protein